jgi:hypothetical protein
MAPADESLPRVDGICKSKPADARTYDGWRAICKIRVVR